jgi:hypothetical protein
MPVHIDHPIPLTGGDSHMSPEVDPIDRHIRRSHHSPGLSVHLICHTISSALRELRCHRRGRGVDDPRDGRHYDRPVLQETARICRDLRDRQRRHWSGFYAAIPHVYH